MAETEHTPRTWTLHSPSRYYPNVVAAGDGLGMQEEVQVIELEPVLDLLEDLKTDIRTIALRGRDGCDGFAEDEADILLKAHGRLDV